MVMVSLGLTWAGPKFNLGDAATFLKGIHAQNLHANSTYTFYSNLGQPIPVLIEDISREGDHLSMVGRAQESSNSDFILKGNPADIYGWVVLKHRNVAYEYTTDDNGILLVEEIPVTKIFPDCIFPDATPDPTDQADQPDTYDAYDTEALQAEGIEPHIGPYDKTPVNKFQSKPGAPKVLYWDITETENLFKPEQMWEAWQTFSATVSMFDVNVTTDPNVWAKTPVANRGRSRQVTGTGRSSCGLNSFGTARACNIYKKSSPAYQGGTLGHEVGHQLGLSHDGSSKGAYFGGIASFRWTPMMGSHASGIKNGADALLQYSKGEYTDANQKQDDFALITRRHLDYRAKLHNGLVPLKFGKGTEIPALQNRGQIVRSNNKDEWTFRIASGGGHAKLRVARTERPYGSMLDVEAAIINASGKEVARSNPTGRRHAEFDLALPAGTYTLAVKGGAEGTPLSGFSNYSSLGFYAISGSITGAAGSSEVPTRIATQAELEKSIALFNVNSMLSITLPEYSQVERMRVVSASGKTVFDSREKVHFIDMSTVPSGFYVLHIEVDGMTVRRNIVNSSRF